MSTLAEKLELVTFDDGSLLVNLETGTYFGLNETAAIICRELLGGASELQIRGLLISHHGLSDLHARQVVDSVTAALSEAPPHEEPVGALRYRPTDWGYAFHLTDRPLLETRRDGSALRLVAEVDASVEMVEGWVRCLAAKILSLQGVTVLHASACAFEDRAIAICGQSGAGKTTTARALGAA